MAKTNVERFGYIGHGRTECSCGETVYECPCPGPHGPTRIVQNGCLKCRLEGKVSDVDVSTERMDHLDTEADTGNDTPAADEGETSLDEERQGASVAKSIRDIPVRLGPEVQEALAQFFNSHGYDAKLGISDDKLAEDAVNFTPGAFDGNEFYFGLTINQLCQEAEYRAVVGKEGKSESDSEPSED